MSGYIGPRRPTMSGENCMNCGSVFVMEPGYRVDQETGIRYARWTCPGCGRKDEWPAGRDPNWQIPITSKDLIE